MMSLPSRKTIYDLSLMCGASASTVSAVLNGSWRKRRIGEATALRIQALAAAQGYRVNLQARGLRSARSGLVGLLLPIHDNRYFSAMAQTFQAQVRLRGQCPLVVSGRRDPAEERELVERLIAHAIDALLIVGSADPDALHEVCAKAGLPHVNIDLPGRLAPSVISDNHQGARALTEAIIRQGQRAGPLGDQDVCLFGGRDDHASRARVRGFVQAKQTLLGASSAQCIWLSGYSAAATERTFTTFCEQRGRLPPVFFVNSSINLEGLLRFCARHPSASFADTVVGCFDYDPFASFLPFPVFMVRQDSETMVARSLELLDNGQDRQPGAVILVPPTLVPPRTALPGPLDDIRDDIHDAAAQPDQAPAGIISAASKVS